MDFLKRHWTWAVGIVAGLWVLSKLLGKSTTAVGANLSMPTGTSVVYGGTNANDAAIQVAQLTAQTQLAQAQVAGNLSVQQAQLAAQANQDTQTANVEIADIQAAHALAISNNQTTLGLAQVKYGSETTIAQARYGSEAAIAQAQYGAAVSIAQTQADVALGMNYNATQLAAFGIQAGVVQNQTDALRQIALAQSQSNTEVQMAYLSNQAQVINNQAQLIEDTYALERAGVFNRGGEGGVNQVAAWGAIINPGSAAAGDIAAAQTAVGSSTQIGDIISSIGDAAGTTLSGLTGLVGPKRIAAAA